MATKQPSKVEELKQALAAVRLKSYLDDNMDYHMCWCLHMPKDLSYWWIPENWEHDWRCKAAQQAMRIKDDDEDEAV